MLTGDKEETAVNIGFSSGLITNETQRLFINARNQDKLMTQIKQSRDSQIAVEDLVPESVIVVSGESLILIESNQQLKKLFLSVVSASKVVIACRLSPKQKADLTTLMKKFNKDKVIMAVGDGANDVSMITQANVGIGIRGMEGSQACSAADYSVGQFKALVPLLLGHGRECNRRNSYMVAYSFYKNFLYTTPLLLYGIVSQWSG